MTDSYYRHHVFVCTNQREDNIQCCQDCAAQSMRDYAKARIKALGMDGEGGVRINTAGCLGRCHEGPVMVVYPQGIWYTYIDQQDIDEIIDEHLRHGRLVKRLVI